MATIEDTCGECGKSPICNFGRETGDVPPEADVELAGYLQEFGDTVNDTILKIYEYREEWIKKIKENKDQLTNANAGVEPSRRSLAAWTIFSSPPLSDRADKINSYISQNKNGKLGFFNDYTYGFDQVIDLIVQTDRKKPDEYSGQMAEVDLYKDPSGNSLISRFISSMESLKPGNIGNNKLKLPIAVAGARAAYKLYREFYSLAEGLYPKPKAETGQTIVGAAAKPANRRSPWAK